MHEGLWGQVAGLDGEWTAQRAGCEYLPEEECYVVTLLNTEYRVYPAGKKVIINHSGQKVSSGFIEQLCVLTYLISAKEVPLADKLVKAESLPGGEFFFRGVHSFDTKKLERCFGDSPELLFEAGDKLGAERYDFGDVSIRLDVLPRLPVTIIVWRSDEEFPARATVLFDQTASEQLPFDALLAAVNFTVEALVRAADTIGG